MRQYLCAAMLAILVAACMLPSQADGEDKLSPNAASWLRVDDRASGKTNYYAPSDEPIDFSAGPKRDGSGVYVAESIEGAARGFAANAGAANGSAGCGCDGGDADGCGCGGDAGCAADCGCPSDCSCDSACSADDCESGCKCSRCCLGDPWTLQKCENKHGITYGGWLSAGVTANNHGTTGGAGNAPLGFNNDTNFNINQTWLYAAREAETCGCGFDWGFRFDFIYGVDGPDTQAFGDGGWDFGWGDGNQYGAAIPQLYLEVAYDDLTFKVGHFYTIIGYEVVPAPDNFFYSHAYTMYYGEPFTHTGFLFDYALNENWSVSLGYTSGWDSGFNNKNDADTVLGGVTWTSSDEATSVAYAFSAGNFGSGAALGGTASAGDIYMHSLVFSHDFGGGWSYVFQHDLGDNSGLGAGNNEWYGINQYLIKEINDCWSVGARYEWFRDVDGARVGTGTAGAGNYYAATVGANWHPHANLTLRPEVRYDWFSGVGNPMANGTRQEMLTFGVDVFFTF